MHCELAIMTLPFGTAAPAANHALAYTTGPQAKGELLGCGFADLRFS